MVGAVNETNVVDYQTYMAAHSLLPPQHPWARSPKPVHVARAFQLLASPGTASESRLWAIVVLGHTPRHEALEVLRELGRSQKRYAGVARLAADECAEWIRLVEEEEAQLHGAQLDGAQLDGAQLDGAQLDGTQLGQDRLGQDRLDRDRLGQDAPHRDEVVLDQADLDELAFEDALGPSWSFSGRPPADLLN